MAYKVIGKTRNHTYYKTFRTKAQAEKFAKLGRAQFLDKRFRTGIKIKKVK